jgi:hypothetical protein
MSKYDDINYLTYSERVDKKLPLFENKKDLNEFPKEFNNQPIEKIRQFLLFENDDEKKLFNFLNNNQDYVTNKYIEKLKVFKDSFDEEEKLNYLLDYIKEMYGVVTPEVFKHQLEKIFDLENSNFQVSDYQKMINMYFHKPQIDLENEQDRQLFKNIIFDDGIKASQMFANVPDNPVYVSQNKVDEDEEEEDRRAEAA